MRFLPTTLKDAYLIEPEPARDERGAFARTFCEREFSVQGLETRFVQHSSSSSVARGTLRGMHFQREPHSEVKLVRCVRGGICDVIVDLRPDSPTFRRWEAFELNAENGRQLYIPPGFGHGFQTLVDDTELSYLISAHYVAGASTGYRYDDPSFSIDWPLPVALGACRNCIAAT